MVFNIGSLNIDHVYRVPHFVRPGESLACGDLLTGPGGKGLNQSIALARAGATVTHLGCIGADGTWLRDLLADDGVHTTHIHTAPGASGHAIIQVDACGENAIILHSGANRQLTSDHLAVGLANARPADFVLLQNETSAIAEAITLAADCGCQVWFNPAPYDATVRDLPLHRLAGLIVNETEACDLAGCADHAEAVPTLRQRYPTCRLVCTLGSQGVRWIDSSDDFTVPAVKAQVVDTTAAGDTFIGYLLAALAAGQSPQSACHRACAAAALTVSRPGAATAIPHARELTAVATAGDTPSPQLEPARPHSRVTQR